MMLWNEHELGLDTKNILMSKIRRSYQALLTWDGEGISYTCLDQIELYGLCQSVTPLEMVGAGNLVRSFILE